MSSLPIEIVERLSSQANVYRLLARLWQREIDQPLLQEMNRQPLSGVMTELGWTLTDETEDQLAEDFCGLFVGPSGHRIPSQSLWTEGKLVGAATEQMGKYWELMDQSVQRPAGLAEDHFGGQLEVMANMIDAVCFHYDPECQHEESVACEMWSELQIFSLTYLSWISKAASFYKSKAQTQFYRGLVQVTENFIENELEYFGQMS